MIEEKFKPGTPQNCVFNNGLYQRYGLCNISEGLKEVNCVYLDTKNKNKRIFRDKKTNEMVSLLCYQCNYQKED